MTPLTPNSPIKRLAMSLLIAALLSAPALPLQAGDWYWDNDTGNKDWSEDLADAPNWDTDTNPTTVSGVTPNIFFNDDFVGSNQTVEVRGADKTIDTITLSGPYRYKLVQKGSSSLIFDSGTGGGASTISVVSDVGGDSNHIFNVEIELLDDLEVKNLVNETLQFQKAINLNANTLTIDSTGLVQIKDPLTGTGHLVKSNTGTVEMRTATTFTGDVTVNAGTLELRNASSLEEVNSVIINGGTLLAMSGNPISQTADMVLAGGTYQFSAGQDQTLDNLTLTANSTIRLGSGNNRLTYSSGTYTAGLLTIDDWVGNWSGGGADRIVFNTSLSQDFLDNVYWADQGITGAFQLGSGEIVPVPEPATLLVGGILGFLTGGDILRRRRQS
tara:strand:+ start:34073 stop:35230 length:1158 start_codon:yes stop_codon:yes gene_type:complete